MIYMHCTRGKFRFHVFSYSISYSVYHVGKLDG